MTAVWNTGAGKSFSSRLEMDEKSYKLFFKAGEWNAIVRAGLHDAGTYFVRVFLPKRFTNYARTNLGYNGKNKTKTPLVVNGRLRDGLLPRAYAEARATQTKASILIRMPVPMMENESSIKNFLKGIQGGSAGYNYYANKQVNKVLKRITNEELEAMAQVMQDAIRAMISGATPTVNKRGKTSLSLTHAQRASVAHTTKPQGSIHNATKTR